MNKKLLFILMFLSLSVFGQKTDEPKLSAEHLKLRTELENDSSFIKIECGLFTRIDPAAKQEFELQKEAIKIRQKLFNASKDNTQTIKAKAFCRTDEGTTVVVYLIVDKGKVKYVSDYSRDQWGGFSIVSYDCEKLLLGYFVDNKEKMRLDFIPFQENENIGNRIPVLQCQSENREFHF